MVTYRSHLPSWLLMHVCIYYMYHRNPPPLSPQTTITITITKPTACANDVQHEHIYNRGQQSSYLNRNLPPCQSPSRLALLPSFPPSFLLIFCCLPFLLLCSLATGMVQTGLSLADGTLASTPVADWERKVKITLMTAVNMTRAAIPQMQAQKHGRIIVRVCVGVWVAFCLSS